MLDLLLSDEVESSSPGLDGHRDGASGGVLNHRMFPVG